MTYKPDYGLRLNSDGISSEVDLTFYDFRLFSLTVLALGQYSTMAERRYEGEWHAVSLDFNQDQLEQILFRSPGNIATVLIAELSRDPSTPRTIDFDGEVVFDVRAKLGEIQTAGGERFIPLVVQEIL